MALFSRLFVVAALAGLIAGAFITVVHQVATVPVIQAAEVFEQAAEAQPAAHDHGVAEDHDHDGGWSPGEGWARAAFTALADAVTGIGFALLLVAAYALKGGRLDWRRGLFWGLAGFAAVALAPGLGLPPELPGTAAAPLAARQLWWVATAVMTAGGLALIFFGTRPLLALLGVVLIVLPHAYGAPQPAEFASTAPEALAHRFVVAVTMTSLLFWLALGSATGFLYDRAFKQG